MCRGSLDEDVNPTNEAELVSQFLRALQIFIQRGGACPVGSIIPYLGGDVPYGWLLANGASVLRSQYNKLFALIGTKFGAVDEAHFNLPNLHHRFIEGTTSLSEVGSYIEAGLPNIKGVFTPIVSRSNCTATGSISSFTANVGANVVAGTGDCIDRGIELNASSSSPVFGASSSVQPAGLYGLLLIRFQ